MLFISISYFTELLSSVSFSTASTHLEDTLRREVLWPWLVMKKVLNEEFKVVRNTVKR